MNRYNFSLLSPKQQAKKTALCAGYLLGLIGGLPGSGPEDELRREYSKLSDYVKAFKFRTGAAAPPLPAWDVFSGMNGKEKTENICRARYAVLDSAGISQPESDFADPTAPVSGPVVRLDLIAFADDVRSPFNIGSVIRTAEAFGFKSVVLSGLAAVSNRSKVLRAAMSAESRLEIVRLTEISEAREWLELRKKEGFEIICLEKTEFSEPIPQDLAVGRAVIAVGNEEFGISETLLGLSDRILHIPLRGSKNSLNLAVAFGIAASRIRSA